MRRVATNLVSDGYFEGEEEEEGFELDDPMEVKVKILTEVTAGW